MILFFGLLRPYKGLDTLLEAYAGIEGAELWIVGNPRMDVEPLRAAAARARGPGPLPDALRRGRRDPADTAARRCPRTPLSRRRAVGRPLHRPRVRQADGAERGRRVPRGRRRTAPASARPARGPRRARRRARAARSATRRSGAHSPRPPPPRRPAPTRGTPAAARTPRSLRGAVGGARDDASPRSSSGRAPR